MFNLILMRLFYEGQSKITESWLLYLCTGLIVLSEAQYTYRMNILASLHIELMSRHLQFVVARQPKTVSQRCAFALMTFLTK